MASASNSMRLSREDYKKAHELEELRKSGVAPPEVDAQGRMINPHIPQYISQKPWYFGDNTPGLQHQYSNYTKSKDETEIVSDLNIKYKKGVKAQQLNPE